MSRLRTQILPLLFLLLAAGASMLVLRDEPPAPWLAVEADAHVVAGHAFQATVSLVAPEDGTFLDFDLHGADARKQSLRCVAAGTSQAVTSGQKHYTFALAVPGRTDLATVHAVIYLSRTGSWRDALQVAKSDPVQVRRGDSPHREVVALAVHEQHSEAEVVVRQPVGLRATTAVLWLGCAGLAVATVRRAHVSRRWPVMGLVFVALAAWEATSAGTLLADFARSLARDGGVYEDRRNFQQVITAGGFCLLAGGAAWALRRSRRPLSGLTLSGLALYGAASLAGLLSLHEVDRVLASEVLAVPLAAALRLAGAGLALGGCTRRFRATPDIRGNA